MTLWQSGGLAFGYAVCAIAWRWGGRPERFAAGVLLLSALPTDLANGWVVGGFRPGFIAVECAILLAFGWLTLRSNRWWVLAATAAAGLVVLVAVLRLLNPTLSHSAMVSAKIGLAYVIDLALLLGVWERWLAGEAAAARAAWAQAMRVTAARRNRRGASEPG